MSMAKAACLVALMLTFVGLNGCKNKQTGEGAKDANGNSNAQATVGPGGVAGGKLAAATTFRGTIGDKKVQLKLFREGELVNGTYSYQKIGKDILLKGSINSQGNFTLQEFDGTGTQTGEFKGKWTDPAELPTAALEGTWTKPNKTGELQFYATEQGIAFTTDARFDAKQIIEENKKLKYSINVEYPELVGVQNTNAGKFNQEVRNLINKEVKQFKDGFSEADQSEQSTDTSTGSDIQIGYSIIYATDALVSTLFDVSTYSAGAAHPNGYSLVVNFDLKNGKLLALGDLFKSKSDYLNAISKYSISALKKGGGEATDTDWIEKGAGPDAENYANWNVSKKGIAITFDPYQVASYAEGPKHVIVPYSLIKDVAKPDGPLTGVMNKT